MAKADYTLPVANLLKLGSPIFAVESDKWLDYQQTAGIGSEDIPQLIRLATDDKLEDVDLEDDDLDEEEEEQNATLLYGPIHALRALGQLKAQEAAEPLLSLLDWEDDFVDEDLPRIYALIGPAANPILAEYVAKHNQEEDILPILFAVDCITAIGKQHPQAQAECSDVLLRQLELYKENDQELNACLIIGLAAFKAEKALPLIETVFNEDKVDILHIDWDTTQFEFGLIDEATYKQREPINNEKRKTLHESLLGPLPKFLSEIPPPVTPKKNKLKVGAKDKAKTKRKIADASKKKNRKRK